MNTVQSKLTAQGQISVPAEVRKKLGLAPGSVIEWEERGGQVIVRKAGKYGCADVYSALFPGKPAKHKRPQDVKDGIRKYIRKYIRKRHALG